MVEKNDDSREITSLWTWKSTPSEERIKRSPTDGSDQNSPTQGTGVLGGDMRPTQRDTDGAGDCVKLIYQEGPDVRLRTGDVRTASSGVQTDKVANTTAAVRLSEYKERSTTSP